MTDDLSGYPGERPRSLPERPVAGPPIVPPPVTPPPPGTPPPGHLSAVGSERWRTRHALLAFLAGFVATQILVTVIGLVWADLGGIKFEELSDNGSFVLVASAINSVMLVAGSLVVTRMLGPVKLRDFGLLRAPFWGTVGRMALVMVSYIVLLALYSDLVDLAPDSAPDKLDAAASDLHMVAFVVMVAVLAPIAEEFFFRGLLFRAIANSIGVVGGVVISGVLFGAMHIDSTSAERLLQVVPLVILGVAFALLYDWSGTLYAPIGLHATNNALAAASYADKHDSEFGIMLSGAVWVLMMLLCILGPRFTDRGPRRASVPYSVR